MKVDVAYDDDLLKWRLGVGHPTNPERAKNAIHRLEGMGADLNVRAIERVVTLEELKLVHSARYLDDLFIRGECDEWSGSRPDLAKTAVKMFAGTAMLVDDFLADKGPRVAFSPMGAKHHAHWDHSSGFCVLNDFAYAARVLSDEGERVLYVDFDAHHGDGVEALTYDNSHVMTASIHDRTIFPGTGNHSEPQRRAFNYPLDAGSGDRELAHALDRALDTARLLVDPTIVLVACGGDGHELDPLSTLRYSYDGYRRAGLRIGTYAATYCGGRVLIGGAGGYRPDDATPQSWAECVYGVSEAVEATLAAQGEDLYTRPRV